LIFAALLLACPPPPIGHLYNNTSEPIEYCSGWRCKDIARGRTTEVRLTYSEPFRFSIRVATRELDFEIAERVQIGYARREPQSNCPNCPRYYFQLEPDMRIFILNPELTPPISSLPAQPAGFPLEPRERAA
jgi:hypothetical protein